MAGCPAPKTRIANLEFRPVIQSNGGAAQRNCLLDPQNIICWSLSQLVSLKPPWAQPLFLLFCLCPLFLSSFSNKCLTTSNKKLVETRIRIQLNLFPSIPFYLSLLCTVRTPTFAVHSPLTCDDTLGLLHPS